MKKVFLVSLIAVLLGALIVPAIVAPAPAAAWSGTVTCSVNELNFRVYSGVPTYLLGFIPLDDGQTLTLTHAGGFLESAGWTVADNAGWLNEDPLFGVVGCVDRDQDVTVRVNTDGMAAGTYTAAITFTFTTCATKTITVPVTVEVMEPAVLGPLCIGVDKELLKNIVGDPLLEEENEYSGLVMNLLTNPEDVMDMQAIETDGNWGLYLKCQDNGGVISFVEATLTINGVEKPVNGGTILPLTALMGMMPEGLLEIPEGFDWGDNRVVMLYTDEGMYLGILAGDIGKLLDLLPALGGLFATEEPAGTDLEGIPSIDSTNNGAGGTTPSTELTIPLKPILKLLPTLMPVLSNLLSNETVLAIMKPLMEMLPPIMIIIPMEILLALMEGMMM